MLNITKTIEYSLIAIRHINDNGNNRLCTSKEISKTYNIPKEILAKTMQKLCKKGYLNTIKGAYGGYYLNTKLEKISLIKFIEDIEGPIGVFGSEEKVSDQMTRLITKYFPNVSEGQIKVTLNTDQEEDYEEEY